MSRLTRIEQFPAQFFRVCEVVGINRRPIIAAFPDEVTALNIRREFYSFRKLMHTHIEHEALARQADIIVVRLLKDPVRLEFVPRDITAAALALDEALDAQAGDIATQPQHSRIISPSFDIDDKRVAPDNTAPDGRDLGYLNKL